MTLEEAIEYVAVYLCDKGPTAPIDRKYERGNTTPITVRLSSNTWIDLMLSESIDAWRRIEQDLDLTCYAVYDGVHWKAYHWSPTGPKRNGIVARTKKRAGVHHEELEARANAVVASIKAWDKWMSQKSL